MPIQSVDSTEVAPTALNHSYFVLEKHTKEVGDKDKDQANTDYPYATPEDRTYYEATNADLEDDYDTTEQGQSTRGNRSKPINVYNTFNDFKQQDDYDHLGDQTKPLRVTENEYNTTQGAMAPADDDDTYNHLNQGPKTTPRPDNVYGIPRTDDDYDRMPPV